jgi:poly-beta-1,6-N-acetyl-D-glucosamine synthase
MVTFYLLFAIVYGLLILRLSKVWRPVSLPAYTQESNESVSIIVPFRNEEQNLKLLFDSIIKLSFRPFQVVFVNDVSQDQGQIILEGLIDQNQDLDIQFEILENYGKGKKDAVNTAIKRANGKFVLTTDADCILPRHWVETMLIHLSKPIVRMTAGPVMTLGGKSFFDHFQQIEWASILLVTQAGFELGNPIMCSAANMAYEKTTFDEIKPYRDNSGHLSGDDEFLLKKMVSTYGADAVTYISHNLVWTKPQISWRDLFSQRIRWISKWRFHKSFNHAFFTLIPMIIQLIFISSFVLVFQGKPGVLVFFLLWITKCSVEGKVLSKVLHSFDITHDALAYFLTSILHPFYVFSIGIGSLFGKFEWKGRSSSHLL